MTLKVCVNALGASEVAVAACGQAGGNGSVHGQGVKLERLKTSTGVGFSK